MKNTRRARWKTFTSTAVLTAVSVFFATVAIAADHKTADQELECPADTAAFGSPVTASLPVGDAELAETELLEKTLRGELTRLASSHSAGHWRLADVESRLGEVLAVQGRLEEAEPMLRRSYVALQTQCSALDSRTRRALARLADFYRARMIEKEPAVEVLDMVGGGRTASTRTASTRMPSGR